MLRKMHGRCDEEGGNVVSLCKRGNRLATGDLSSNVRLLPILDLGAEVEDVVDALHIRVLYSLEEGVEMDIPTTARRNRVRAALEECLNPMPSASVSMHCTSTVSLPCLYWRCLTQRGYRVLL